MLSGLFELYHTIDVHGDLYNCMYPCMDGEVVQVDPVETVVQLLMRADTLEGGVDVGFGVEVGVEVGQDQEEVNADICVSASELADVLQLEKQKREIAVRDLTNEKEETLQLLVKERLKNADLSNQRDDLQNQIVEKHQKLKKAENEVTMLRCWNKWLKV